MFNEDYKQIAISNLTKADQQYSVIFKRTIQDMERLYKTRTTAIRVIQKIEVYIIGLANRPRNFDTQIGEIKVRYIKFQNTMNEIQELNRQEMEKAEKRGLSSALFGMGAATLAPTAAMAVAMTFGTASTGTAIATLSGAAATNAALAWLGGGALAAGGLGIAGGQAILNLAGPIGWALSGVSVAVGVLAKSITNQQMAEKAEQSTRTIKREAERIKEVDAQVLCWNKETVELCNKLSRQLNNLKTNRKKDYKKFTENEKHELLILMNATEVLSKNIGKTMRG